MPLISGPKMSKVSSCFHRVICLRQHLPNILTLFSLCESAGGPPLDESFWHVTDYYDNIRNKLKTQDPEVGACNELKEMFPARVCHTPMKVRVSEGTCF